MRNNVKNDSNLYIVEELERLSMNDKFVDDYDAEIVNKKMMNSMKYEGYQEGKSDGINQERIEIAKKMLSKTMD